MSESTTRTTGFRPTARRRNRIAAGVALGAIAIGGNVLVYSSLDDAEPVVQAVRDIPAGTEITPGMLRSVDADLDDSIDAIPANQLEAISGRFAKVRIVSGSLVSANSLQSDPLVSAGRSVVALQVSRGALPIGLRERSRVQLVVPPTTSATSVDGQPTVVEGRTVGLPIDANSALGTVSLSVEVGALDAPAIAAADDVRVVLLEQQPDPAFESEGG
ncbi:MAG: SAF domain-containing protein [Ilumatobacter sp.]|uniref:SAF domain-containing protein n=1 Tax=Ilumatobacter sp. TaxID=1967498 RepID=UPI00391B0CC4